MKKKIKTWWTRRKKKTETDSNSIPQPKKKIKTLKSNEVTFVCETCWTEADDRSYTS